MTVTIAVVEDDVRILDALKMVRVAEGRVVTSNATGEEFLADLVNDAAPQCLVLDPHLSGIDSTEVAHAVINGDVHSDIPIIVLTASPKSAVTRQTIAAGAHATLMKPVTAEKLIGKVQAVIYGAGSEL